MSIIIDAAAGTSSQVAADLGADVIAMPSAAVCRQAMVACWLAAQPAATSNILQPLFERCALLHWPAQAAGDARLCLMMHRDLQQHSRPESLTAVT